MQYLHLPWSRFFPQYNTMQLPVLSLSVLMAITISAE